MFGQILSDINSDKLGTELEQAVGVTYGFFVCRAADLIRYKFECMYLFIVLV